MSYLAAFALGFVSALALIHYAARARPAVPRIDWIEQVNGCLPKQDSEP